MLNLLGGVVRCNINSTPPDSGLTHTVSCYLPFHCFENKIFLRYGRTDLANCWAAVVSAHSCRMSRVTAQHIHVPAPTIGDMEQQYLHDIWWIWCQYWIRLVTSLILIYFREAAVKMMAAESGSVFSALQLSCTFFCELYRKKSKKQYLEVGRQADDGQMSEFVPLCWGQLWEWGCSLYIKEMQTSIKKTLKNRESHWGEYT